MNKSENIGKPESVAIQRIVVMKGVSLASQKVYYYKIHCN